MTELELKAAVRSRDGFRCTQCGMTAQEHFDLRGYNLHVHRKVPGTAYTVEGCVTLCHPCHGEVHRGPRRNHRPGCCVKIESALANTCRRLAKLRRCSIQAVVSDLLRAPIRKEYEQAKRQFVKDDK